MSKKWLAAILLVCLACALGAAVDRQITRKEFDEAVQRIGVLEEAARAFRDAWAGMEPFLSAQNKYLDIERDYARALKDLLEIQGERIDMQALCFEILTDYTSLLAVSQGFAPIPGRSLKPSQAEIEGKFSAALARLEASMAKRGSTGHHYTVLEVIDGDTIIIEDALGIRTRVRLRRIDAPELDEPGGPEAKEKLEAKLLGRKVKVTGYAHDIYGRLVAQVEAQIRPTD